jgi:hypothetical protein
VSAGGHHPQNRHPVSAPELEADSSAFTYLFPSRFIASAKTLSGPPM